MHTDTMKDPFSTMLQIFQTSPSYIKPVQVAVEEKNAYIPVASVASNPDDMSQFQKALAACNHQKNVV
jgi:hypothetical protein